MIICHFEKLNDIVKVIEATRGIGAVVLALNGLRGFDGEMSGKSHILGTEGSIEQMEE